MFDSKHIYRQHILHIWSCQGSWSILIETTETTVSLLLKVIFRIAYLKASIICPSWISSSAILLMMSSRFGSFKKPVAFGSTWIVKSLKKTISDKSLNKICLPAAHSLLGWSWVAWGCLPTVLSSPDPWSSCQTFWKLPGKFSFRP